jgi:hypothetical protein
MALKINLSGIPPLTRNFLREMPGDAIKTKDEGRSLFIYRAVYNVVQSRFPLLYIAITTEM